MPIYEYRCEACGFQKEFMQRMSDAPLTDCPKCHKRALIKLVSAAGFQLKGTGWYATDFKNSSKTAANPGTKSDTKADTKSDKGEGKSADKADSSNKESSNSCGSGACPACS